MGFARDTSLLPTLLLGAVAALWGCGPQGPGGSTSAAATAATANATAPLSSTGTLPSTATPPSSAAPPASAAITASATDDGDDKEEPGLPSQAERRPLESVADEPAIDANRAFVADHYGVVQLPFPLQLQTMRLTRGRRALLLTGQGPALEKPLVLVVGQTNALLWSKPRPLAGTHEQAREMTISRGPHGQVYLFLYDEPSKVLAARAWTSEGGIFADFQVLTVEGCDAVTVHYWAGHGWVAALLSAGVLHAQLLGENGSLAWPGNGIEVPGAPGAAAANARGFRPKIEIAEGQTIEITVGARKVRVSAQGVLLK